ncbi:protein farnesyltransferase/geranylgeranyltransferase type-1 subunit alpha [Cydia splendana]|uniref:protein farnesyltransferase/geranylgeranyltransferase type-1 subunit alpha n=1 Tax=Cydia splendana TaxID=1100963 RepID=UPI00212D5489
MSDNEYDGDATWVPYRDRPEWKDVTPVPENDGPRPVVVIAHSEKFEDVYGYFRAVLQSNEKSERALKLTKDAVELNPANYTVWQYRRDLLKALGTDLRPELEYVESVITNSPKNYQVWHHRKVLVEWLQDPSQELALTSDALIQDPKNYHAWQHRQWAIKTFGLYDREMDFVDNLITQDVRNNSAWNQRYFIMNNHLGWSDMNVQKEICYTMEKIKYVKNNESAWNYLRGLLLHDKRGLSGNCVVTGFCEELYKNKCRSPFLLAFILDICDEAIKKDEIGCLHNPTRGVALCEDLATKYDKIRGKYWNYMSEKFRKAKDELAAKNEDGDKVERTI